MAQSLYIFALISQDWSLKYDQDIPVQPRYDINAPDLYIPTMAYITFVVLAGLIMGKIFLLYFPINKYIMKTFFDCRLFLRRHAKSIYTRTVGNYFVKCTRVQCFRIDDLFNNIVRSQHINNPQNARSSLICRIQICSHRCVHFG